MHGTKARHRYDCPYCSFKSADLRRHLKLMHDIKEKKELNVILARLREEKKKRERRESKEYKAFDCTEPNCGARVRRLDAHLWFVHQKPSLGKSCKKKPGETLIDQIVVNPGEKMTMIVGDSGQTATNSQETFCPFAEEPEPTDQTAPSNSTSSYSSAALEMGKWLTGLDGGNRRLETVKQRVSQMTYLLSEAHVESNDHLLNRSTFWPVIHKNVQSGVWRADTGRFYLTTLKDFYQFIIDTNHFMMTKDELFEIQAISNKVDKWKKSLKALSKSQNAEAKEIQLTKIHNQDAVTKVLTCASFDEMRNLIINLSKEDKPKLLMRNIYTYLVQLLITIISIRAPKRSGVLCEMTVENFNNRETHEEQFLVKVKNHKTSGTYGSALVPLSEFHVKWLTVYLEKARPPVVKDNEDQIFFFLKYNGSKYNSQDISRALSAVWESADLGKTTTNLFRKSLVTEGDLEDTSQRENISTLLDNSVVTAQKHYRLITKPTGVVNAATFADKLMFGEKGAAILDLDLGK